MEQDEAPLASEARNTFDWDDIFPLTPSAWFDDWERMWRKTDKAQRSDPPGPSPA